MDSATLLLLLLLILQLQLSWQQFASEVILRRPIREAPYCSYRCSRIYQRSLNRMNENLASVQYLFERLEPAEDILDACWKSYDYLDCMGHCELQNRQRLAAIRNVIKDRCRNFVKGDEASLACISKFHTFIEVRCSSYMSEAMRYSKHGKPRLLQESCRFMYYHSLCLVNNVYNYCPSAVHLFTHANLRNYFLSFLLPADDRQVSEDFLDECQIHHFGRTHTTPKTSSATTKAIVVTHPDEQVDTTTISSSSEEKASDEEENSTKAKAAYKKLFSPDEDLMDAPPNFFYSSLRSMRREWKPLQEDSPSEYRSRNDSVGFLTLSNRKHASKRLGSSLLEQSSLENAYKSVNVDIFDPETTTTIAHTLDDISISWSHRYQEITLPTIPAVTTATTRTRATAIPVALIHTPTTSTASATTTVTTVPSRTATEAEPMKSPVQLSISSTINTVVPMKLVSAKSTEENYTIERPTATRKSIESTTRTFPQTNANENEVVKTLPTDSTGDEYFEHLVILPVEMAELTSVRSNPGTAKISREDGITIEMTPSDEMVYTHNTQAGDKEPTTATTTAAALVPQPLKNYAAPLSPSSSVASDYAELLNQMDIPAKVLNFSDTNNDSRKTKPTEILRPLILSSTPRTPSPITTASKAVTVYKIFQNLPKGKIYQVFPLPTITTTTAMQVLVTESTQSLTTTTQAATVNSNKKLYETKLMWKVIDETSSSSSEANKETMRPTFVRSNGQIIDTDSIKSREEIGKVDFPKDMKNETIFERTQPAPSAIIEELIVSTVTAVAENNEASDLFFIYAVLIFVSLLASAVLLATIALRS